jgi:hypothetical protein
VNWEEELNPVTGPVIETPHARDFLRVTGPEGQHTLTLTFRQYRPSEADAGHGPDLVLESEVPEQTADSLSFRPTACGFSDVAKIRMFNRGNQFLAVSNLVLTGSGRQHYSARFLSADNSVVSLPVLTVDPGASAILQVDFAPTSGGIKRAAVQFKSSDPDADQSVVSIPLEGKASHDAAVRIINGNRTESPNVLIQIPATIGFVDRVEELLPEGVIPSHISANGAWDAGYPRLQWHNLSGGMAVEYRIHGTNIACSLSGHTLASGRSSTITGHARILVFASTDSDNDGLPDWWEHKFFDSLTNALPKLDSDRDGRENLAEFQEATNPLDAGFQVQEVAPYLQQWTEGHGRWDMQVLGFEGATYRIEESNDFSTWRVASSNLLASEKLVLSATNISRTGAQFYRAVRE